MDAVIGIGNQVVIDCPGRRRHGKPGVVIDREGSDITIVRINGYKVPCFNEELTIIEE
jgi:hypothetical protein